MICFIKVEENNYDKDLFSIIAYLKSGTVSNLRRIENGTDEIEGTISPSFLIGKSHFVFQEDLYFDIEKIQNDIDLLIDEAIDSDYIEDENLLNFIQNTNEEKIRFDSLYSFYVSKAEFKLHIDNIINEGISTYCYRPICFIGCGTDRGCCGSYSGCCYYSHTLCLIHDRQCATCVPPQGFPSWYCGPDCQPDTEDTRDVKILIGG